MVNPQISIIIPVYNTEAYLARCVRSVLAQSFSDFEIILINDGSTDLSGEICNDFAFIDTRVRVYHKENEGVSSARNMGLDHALGDWIIFLDSDDWIDENMLNDMYNEAYSQSADIVYSDIKVFNKDNINVIHIAKYNQCKVELLNNFISSTFSTVVGMLVKKNLYLANNIHFPNGVAYCEDFYVAVRLMLFSTKIVYVSTPYYCYNRQNELSASVSYLPKHYSSVQWVYADTIDFFKNENQYDKYAKTLSWRLLNSEQDLVLDKTTYDKFRLNHPDCHKYIWSCPYLNRKTKIMMWALSHNIPFIAELLLCLRSFRLKCLSGNKQH